MVWESPDEKMVIFRWIPQDARQNTLQQFSLVRSTDAAGKQPVKVPVDFSLSCLRALAIEKLGTDCLTDLTDDWPGRYSLPNLAIAVGGQVGEDLP